MKYNFDKRNLLWGIQNFLLAFPLIFFPKHSYSSLTGTWYDFGLGISVKLGSISNNNYSCYVFLNHYGVPLLVSIILSLLLIYGIRIIRNIEFKKEIYNAIIKISTSLFLLAISIYFINTFLWFIGEYIIGSSGCHEIEKINLFYFIAKVVYSFTLGFLVCLSLVLLFRESILFKKFTSKLLYYLVIIMILVLIIYPGMYYLSRILFSAGI